MAQRGYTLVEVMVVVAILAIIGALVVPNYVAYRRMAERNTCIANMKQILNAEELFYMQRQRYATDVSELCGSHASATLKQRPQCPCGGTYKFIAPTASAGATVTCTGGTYADGYAHSLESTGSIVADD